MKCSNCSKQKLIAHKPIKIKIKHNPKRLHGGNNNLEIVTDIEKLTECVNRDDPVSRETIENIENNKVTGIVNKLTKDNILTCYFTDSLLKSLASTSNRDPLTKIQYSSDQVESIYVRASQKAKNFYNQNIGQQNLRLDLVQDAVGSVQNNMDYSNYEGEELYLSNNNIEDVSQLTLPNSLEVLDLINNRISDVSQLRLPNSLKTLRLENNNIEDVSQLRLPNSLKELDLSNNQISDVSQLRLPNSLEELDLENNQISDVSQLRLPNSLKRLFLQDNRISDVSQLTLPNSLELLILSNNNIEDVSQLTLPNSLEYLWIDGNRIEDVSKNELRERYPGIVMQF